MKAKEVLGVFFVVTLLVSNILAVKIISFGSIILPAAVILYPFCFMLGDVITELWGFKHFRKVILMGFAANALMVSFFILGGLLPPASFWDRQEAYLSILGIVPRICLASIAAYLVGELINGYVLDWIKSRYPGSRLFLRTIGSTIVGQFFDTMIFITIAFGGTMKTADLLILMAGQYVFKVLIEALLGTPLAYRLIRIVRGKIIILRLDK